MRCIGTLLFLLPYALAAQHCGYDGAAIIVVHPHGMGDSTVIGGLRITLLDSNNVPVTYSGRPYEPFFRNTDRGSWDAPGVNHRPGRDVDHLYPFAQDNYVLVVDRGMDLRGCSVLVQDERPWGSGPVFRQVVVPVDLEVGYSLCGRYDDLVYRTYPEERPYAALDITVFQR
ncbi:MAG: hypothetical protein IPO05_08595 [Flavobacteriales bacterium]|jgi:hypothetical protein|nr:hypothetical protein [Flavobacteriales bacterium]MBK9513672.1 hypothetical protein [Flavobacteriales bacterium]